VPVFECMWHLALFYARAACPCPRFSKHVVKLLDVDLYCRTAQVDALERVLSRTDKARSWTVISSCHEAVHPLTRYKRARVESNAYIELIKMLRGGT
jgi:hypothetical protein